MIWFRGKKERWENGKLIACCRECSHEVLPQDKNRFPFLKEQNKTKPLKE